jgi:hypothetical protein
MSMRVEREDLDQSENVTQTAISQVRSRFVAGQQVPPWSLGPTLTMRGWFTDGGGTPAQHHAGRPELASQVEDPPREILSVSPDFVFIQNL